jgi:hypothetical protein
MKNFPGLGLFLCVAKEVVVDQHHHQQQQTESDQVFHKVCFFDLGKDTQLFNWGIS